MNIQSFEQVDGLHVALYVCGMLAAWYAVDTTDDPQWFKVTSVVVWPLLAVVVVAASIWLGIHRVWRYSRRFPGSFPYRPRLFGWPAAFGIRAYRASDRARMTVDVVQMRRYEEEWYVTIACCRWVNGWPGFIGTVDRVYGEHSWEEAVRAARAFADRNGLPHGRSLTEPRV